MHQWRQSTAERARWIGQCLDMGIHTFDHADIYGDYGNEQLFGQALGQLPPSARQRVRIITKCGIKLRSAARPAHRIKSYDASAAHIRASVDHSLAHLGVERLELLLLHRPDLLLQPAEVAATVDALRAAGKIRHFGVSNFSTSQFALLNAATPLVTHQIEFGPLALAPLTDGTLDQCLGFGSRPMAWSPLGGGTLLADASDRPTRVRAVLQSIADEHRVEVATAAYAWLMRHPSGAIPITGSGNIERLRAAIAATQMQMSAEDWYRVLEASQGQEVA